MEGTSQTEFPPCQLVEETIGKGDSIEKSREKTCACGTITKKFDIEGCITVTEAIRKDISSGSNAQTCDNSKETLTTKNCSNGCAACKDLCPILPS